MTNALAKEVQNHVPEQPWGYYGDKPVPLQIWFNADNIGDEPWTVKFVLALSKTGNQRVWRFANGRTLDLALEHAREIQKQAARLPLP